MRYIGWDKDVIYLKCRHCDKIYSYKKKGFEKRSNSKCPICGKGSAFIWCYPIRIPRKLLMPSFLIMTVLSVAIMGIICFPPFQQSYFFNKAVTALNPLFTSILISALCSFLSLDFPKKIIKSRERGGNSESVKRGNLVAVLVECILLVFAINIIMQTQYCSLRIDNPITGEVQQYFGNSIGDVASGEGRLFNSQGKLIYIGDFENNLFDGYGRQFELINTIRDTKVSQTYQCVYEGFYKNGMPNGKGREYRYDAEYVFEKGEDIDPNLYYEGAFIEGKYCGYGTLYGLESKSEGVFFDGVLNGYGSRWYLETSDKKIYKVEGNFLDGVLNGEAKRYYPDGSVSFDGTYENGRRISGVSYFRGGSIRYSGEWEEGDYNGEGILYWKNGQVRYDGSWVDGERSGNGSSFREDGTMEYIGSWLDDRYNGYGKLYFEDGTTIQYDGRYQNGVKNGNGNEYYRDGTVQYSGNWSSGNWDGWGIWFWENGNPYYKGDFVDGNPHGLGVMYLENGTIKYEGHYENGSWNGYGILYDDTGIKNYQGDFFDNRQDGWGTSYWPNGNVQYEGNWKSGAYSGKGKEYDVDGNLLYEGLFSDGEVLPSSMD